VIDPPDESEAALGPGRSRAGRSGPSPTTM
jgi:hypothetical protein